jgi:exosortase
MLVGLFLLTHWPLVSNALRLPDGISLENWFFEPEQSATQLVLGLTAWLIWRRRDRLRSLPQTWSAATAAVVMVPGLGLFVWAQLTRSVDLLLPSLALNLLSLGAVTRGRAGCRLLLLPALVLALPVMLAIPLRHELVWQLQVSTAHVATWVMQSIGYEIVLSGVQITGPKHTFIVIESCSGLRGVEILILVAVVIRELFAQSGRRQWLLVAAAPLLGFALNVIRVVVVAAMAMAGPEEPGPALRDHTAQGVAVMACGTGLLYAMGSWMGGVRSLPDSGRAQAQRARTSIQATRWSRPALSLILVLGVLSVAVPHFSQRSESEGEVIAIPESRADWSSTRLVAFGLFVGELPQGQTFYRRFERARPNAPIEIVDLFIARETVGDSATSRLFTAKIAMPEEDWSIGEVTPTRLWSLGLDAQLISATRGAEHTSSYVWRLRDEGLWWESLRSALALDRSPIARERPRTIVRLTAPLAFDGPLARDRAKQALDSFVVDFRAELTEL